MSKNNFERGKVNTSEEAQKIVENFIFEKSSFFGKHMVLKLLFAYFIFLCMI